MKFHSNLTTDVEKAKKYHYWGNINCFQKMKHQKTINQTFKTLTKPTLRRTKKAENLLRLIRRKEICINPSKSTDKTKRKIANLTD
jgi:hypothetical protein